MTKEVQKDVIEPWRQPYERLRLRLAITKRKGVLIPKSVESIMTNRIRMAIEKAPMEKDHKDLALEAYSMVVKPSEDSHFFAIVGGVII